MDRIIFLNAAESVKEQEHESLMLCNQCDSTVTEVIMAPSIIHASKHKHSHHTDDTPDQAEAVKHPPSTWPNKGKECINSNGTAAVVHFIPTQWNYTVYQQHSYYVVCKFSVCSAALY